MAAKQVALSTDDVTYNILPGGTGEMTREGRAVTDTIFGQLYESQITGPISWGINANAVYKGYAGYVAKLLKQGTSTAMTTEAMALVSGKTYQVTDSTRRIMNRAVTTNVFDNAVNQNANVESIDFLFGRVTFRSTYTVVGPVTITGAFFPTLSLAKFQSFTLTQTAAAINNSDMPNLQANGGFETYASGLKSVSLELPSVFAAGDAWHTALINRSEYIIEINPDGTGLPGSVARGFFRLISDSQSGDVGALEVENLRFALNVPLAQSGPLIARPFGWLHGASSPIPTAIQQALTSWQDATSIYARYLHDGVSGWKSLGIITNMSLAAGMDSPNMFTVAFQGSGAPTII